MSSLSSRIRNLPYYAKKALREGLGWAYAAPATFPRRAVQTPFYEINRLVNRPSAARKDCVYVVSGQSSVNGAPLKAAFVGVWQEDREPALSRYESFLFRPGAARQDRGPCPDGNCRAAAERLAGEVDLVLVAQDRGSLWQPSAGNWVGGPASLRLTVDFIPGETWADFLARAGGDSGLIRRPAANLTYHLSHRIQDFERFYQEMALPTQVPGSGERLPLEEARTLFLEHNWLLLIGIEDGPPVAGAFSYPWHSRVLRRMAGVLGGSQELIDQGLLAACDTFTLQWALERGCAGYDAGICLPFLSGPRVAQLQPWGAQTDFDPWHPQQVLLWAPPGSVSGLEWLSANPIDPRFAQPGGNYLTNLYDELRRAQPAPAPTPRRIPVTSAAAAASSRTVHLEAYGRVPKDAKTAIDHGLYRHSLAALGPELGEVHIPFSVLARDEKGELAGGLIGRFTWSMCHIDSLWVSADYRGRDIGTRLMRIAENAARAQGLHFITLETTNFEAIGFYPKLGYEIAGQVSDPAGAFTLYYLKKMLV